MNDKEFREHLAELRARQRNPDRPAKKNPPTPEPIPKPATIVGYDEPKPVSDIFLSYAMEDLPRQAVVGRAEKRGWPVWWDRIIKPGIGSYFSRGSRP